MRVRSKGKTVHVGINISSFPFLPPFLTLASLRSFSSWKSGSSGSPILLNNPSALCGHVMRVTNKCF